MISEHAKPKKLQFKPQHCKIHRVDKYSGSSNTVSATKVYSYTIHKVCREVLFIRTKNVATGKTPNKVSIPQTFSSCQKQRVKWKQTGKFWSLVEPGNSDSQLLHLQKIRDTWGSSHCTYWIPSHKDHHLSLLTISWSSFCVQVWPSHPAPGAQRLFHTTFPFLLCISWSWWGISLSFLASYVQHWSSPCGNATDTCRTDTVWGSTSLIAHSPVQQGLLSRQDCHLFPGTNLLAILTTMSLQFFNLNPEQLFQTSAALSPSPLLLPNSPPLCTWEAVSAQFITRVHKYTAEVWINSWEGGRNRTWATVSCSDTERVTMALAWGLPLLFQTEESLPCTSKLPKTSKARVSLQCTNRCKIVNGITREL